MRKPGAREAALSGQIERLQSDYNRLESELQVTYAFKMHLSDFVHVPIDRSISFYKPKSINFELLNLAPGS